MIYVIFFIRCIFSKNIMPIRKFIKHNLNKSSNLSKDEERELFYRFQKAKDFKARKKIVKSQAHLVNAIARRFFRTHKKNDLLQFKNSVFVYGMHISMPFFVIFIMLSMNWD